MLEVDFDTLILGHGRLMTKQEVADYKARFEEMNRRVRNLARSGVPKGEVRAKLYLEDLGWNHTVSTTTWETNLERHYDGNGGAVKARCSIASYCGDCRTLC